jgi:hypothetical protein
MEVVVAVVMEVIIPSAWDIMEVQVVEELQG